MISCIGRIAAYKMLLLPKLLYLFRSLPIKIQNKYFATINSKIFFIWSSKKPRTAFGVITKHSGGGGLGVQNIQDYYLSAILDQLSHWWFDSPDKLSVYIERNFSVGNFPCVQEC